MNEIEKNVFRAYDIRGIYPTQINENFAYIFGQGFASHIKRDGKTKCVIAHDNRISSPSLAKALISGIISTGVDVVYLHLTTTPMYYFACMRLGIPSGVMVTASHNPKDDNGFKFAYDENGNCRGETIEKLYKEIVEGNFLTGHGTVTEYNIVDQYINFFKENLDFGDRRVKVVLDPANGATSLFCRKIYEQFPIDLTIINEDNDGSFPNHHPDPCVEENLEQLKKKVLEINADIGISFDGDGDRVGIISNDGTFIPTDKYMIMIVRDIFNKVDKKEFLCDVKCSKSFADEVEKLGGKTIMYRTGNSYTKAKVKDADLPFGGELSGHVYFRDRWPGFDSGMYAGLRLLEILSKTEKSVNDLLNGINNYYATPEIKIATSDEIKFQIVDKVKEYVKTKGYNYLDIDGVRINFPDGWALVRCSNTGPNITIRFEAATENRLAEIKKEFEDIIEELSKELITS